MKILVVTQYYKPEQFRVNDICEELCNRGNEVWVLTGLPNYPTGEIYPGYENKHMTIEKHNGISVVRCKLRPRHRGTVNLIRNYLSFVYQANKLIKSLPSDFDVVYVYELSPITVGIPAIRYKKLNKSPIYLYCCDLWPESVLGEQNGHKQLSRKNIIYIVAKLISKYVYGHVDYIGCKCQEFVEYLHQVCGIDYDKMTVLYEHAEDTYLMVNEDPDDNNIVDFMFLGNIGKVQNCDQIVKAVNKLHSKNEYKLHFVGDGSELQNIKQMVKEYNLEDFVVFHGKHPVSEMEKYYNLADVCLLTLSNRTATGITPPAKLAGYMAAARPVIASINGAATTIIKEAKCGMVVPADDVEGLAMLMQRVLDDPNSLNGLGKSGREYYNRNFTLTKHIDGLENCLKILVQQHRKQNSIRNM